MKISTRFRNLSDLNASDLEEIRKAYVETDEPIKKLVARLRLSGCKSLYTLVLRHDWKRRIPGRGRFIKKKRKAAE